jgi:hypothetical protein
VNKRLNARGGRLRGAVLAVALTMTAVAVVAASSATEKALSETTAPTAGAASAPYVVKTEHKVPPRHKVIRRRFRPWARPSAGQLRRMISIEGRRWHIAPSRLARRVSCESHFHWWAGNGAYQGVLQLSSSSFSRGLSSIRTRKVRVVRKRWRRVREVRILHYSDGHVERKRGRRRRQRLVLLSIGTLPRRPSIVHAWAQLRIGAQAIRGISGVRSSEWSCPA